LSASYDAVLEKSREKVGENGDDVVRNGHCFDDIGEYLRNGLPECALLLGNSHG
jgi:hypothetical protein